MKSLHQSFAAALVCLVAGSVANAQLTDYSWNTSGGTAAWQSGSWTQTGVGSASPYPNDEFHGASLSRPLSGALTVNVDGTADPNQAFVTVGPIAMGGTTSAVTTNIASINGGYLLLKNDDDADFNDDRQVSGLDFLAWQRGWVDWNSSGTTLEIENSDGDADGDFDVDSDDLARWEALYGSTTKFGNALITSGGVPGSTNIISAPIYLSAETLVMSENSTNDLTLSGEIRPTGGVPFGPDSAEERGHVARIRNYSSKTLFITGQINTDDPVDGTNRRIFLNDGGQNHGTIHLTNTSSIVGGGVYTDATNTRGLQIQIGSRSNAAASLPLPTVIMSAANTFTGKLELNRANLVLDNDNALGNPAETTFEIGGANDQIGMNLLSTSDSRNIPVRMKVANLVSIKGEHSLTWSGEMAQTNGRRGVISMLPAGKFFTAAGRVSGFKGDGDSNGNLTTRSAWRPFHFDGTGEIRLTGGFHDDDINNNGIIGDGYNNQDPNDHGARGRSTFVKRGSGVVKVTGTTSTFTGDIRVEGGNLHFDRMAHFSSMTGAGLGQMISTAGAVGLDSSSFDLGFLALFSNSTSAEGGPDVGGLMLSTSDAASAISFGGTAANVRLMTLAAQEGGTTFTGSIAPFNNQYRLGGGSGTLSISGGLLTGVGRSLLVTNGGEVHITSASNIASTGTILVTAKYVSTAENQAANDGVGGSSRVYLGTTLTASVLANGGVNSSIGSGSTADRLLIRGSTLKYVGPNTSTNRLFTVGTGGATINASGTGTVDFSNTGALVYESADPRISTNDSSTVASNVLTGIPSTENLTVGMTVTGLVGGTLFTPGTPSIIPANTTITDILSPTSVQLSNALPVGSWTEGGTFTVTNFTRTVGLTGTNTGNNFMRPLIGNATQGNVGLTKSGTGKWVLTNANTYSGPTAVNAGTLLINGNQSGGSAYTVAAGATLGGSGTLGGVGASLVSSGTVAPGDGIGTLTVGGAYTQNSGASLAVEIAGGASFDTMVVNGAASLAGTINVDLQSFSPAIGQQFNIVTASGGLTTSGLTVTGDGNWTASVVSGNTLRLTFVSALQAIPEPSTLVLVALGVLCAGRRRRS